MGGKLCVCVWMGETTLGGASLREREDNLIERTTTQLQQSLFSLFLSLVGFEHTHILLDGLAANHQSVVLFHIVALRIRYKAPERHPLSTRDVDDHIGRKRGGGR